MFGGAAVWRPFLFADACLAFRAPPQAALRRATSAWNSGISLSPTHSRRHPAAQLDPIGEAKLRAPCGESWFRDLYPIDISPGGARSCARRHCYDTYQTLPVEPLASR